MLQRFLLRAGALALCLAALCGTASAHAPRTWSERQSALCDDGTELTLNYTYYNTIGSIPAVRNGREETMAVVLAPEAGAPLLSVEVEGADRFPRGRWASARWALFSKTGSETRSSGAGPLDGLWHLPGISASAGALRFAYDPSIRGVWCAWGHYTTLPEDAEYWMELSAWALVLTPADAAAFLADGTVYGSDWPGLRELLETDAVPAASTVLVDGTEVPLTAYTIDASRYFNLRDIAQALSGTGKRFDVSWDGRKQAVRISTGTPYTPVGGELAETEATGPQTAALSAVPVYCDGVPVTAAAYTIGGDRFFKLRDLGRLLDFGVAWDAERAAVVIDTAAGAGATTAVAAGGPAA